MKFTIVDTARKDQVLFQCLEGDKQINWGSISIQLPRNVAEYLLNAVEHYEAYQDLQAAINKVCR